MKTKLATTLSIVGVLTAGSAAALVNTQILNSGPTDSGASAAVLPPASSIDLTVPQQIDQSVPSIADTSSTTTTLPALPTAPATGTNTSAEPDLLTAFNVGDAGVVTVDVVDDRLFLVSAEPMSGWSVVKAEDDSSDDSDDVDDEVEVEVVFTSASVRVEFEAHFVDGRIVPTVESKSIGGTAVPSSSNTVDGNDDGDDGDGDRDDDDRDDDRDDGDDDGDDDDDDDGDGDDDDDDDDDADDDDRDDDRDDDDRDDD